MDFKGNLAMLAAHEAELLSSEEGIKARVASVLQQKADGEQFRKRRVGESEERMGELQGVSEGRGEDGEDARCAGEKGVE